MIVIPAIDLKGGKVVRLMQGDFNNEVAYSEAPLEVAKRWEKEGAKLLHIVDLDGALQGIPKNLSIIIDILRSLKVPAEVGGGLRDEKDVEAVLKNGASYAILGTRACEDFDFVKRMRDLYTDKILISVDARDGITRTEGWTKPTYIKPIDFIKIFIKYGVRRFIYTNITRDGMMAGTDIAGIENILNNVNGIELIASGGVSSLKDIKALKPLERKGLFGVIVGKALYEGAFSLRDVQALC